MDDVPRIALGAISCARLAPQVCFHRNTRAHRGGFAFRAARRGLAALYALIAEREKAHKKSAAYDEPPPRLSVKKQRGTKGKPGAFGQAVNISRLTKSITY